MSFISNSNNFFCEHHFIFQGGNILLQTSPEQNSQIKISSEFYLPSENILRKCLEAHVVSDWFAEPEYNYSAFFIEDAAPCPAGCKFIYLRDYCAILENPENHEDKSVENYEQLIALSSRAKAMLSWRKKKRFCSACGEKLVDSKSLSAKFCPKCKVDIFPRIEPCVIVLVSRGDEYLLVRHSQHIQTIYACISGFIESGETAEQCVKREVFEEVGIKVKNLRYVGSQSWPFPDQLMLAFRAEYESGEIKVDPNEISEAKWFNKNDLPAIPGAGSVAHKLIIGCFG